MTWLNWPNRITIGRIVLVVPFVICLLNLNNPEWTGWRYVALVLFSFMAVSDGLDGFLARRLREETPLGRFLDPVADKLLIACAPDAAIFGEKDYQQLLVVRRMVTDLGLPIAIVGHPTVREADGLAQSSRNTYLSQKERQAAPALYNALRIAAAAILAGMPAEAALSDSRIALQEEGFSVDYFELRNADTLAIVDNLASEPLRLLAAARLGKTRLIDNIAV